VLTILCDQLNASVTSTYGGPVPTPNLTRLARSGVLFTQATCNTPFCSPTRATIVTGQYPHTHGVVSNINAGNHGLTGESPTMDRLLKAEGYAVHQYGKWHVSARPMPYYPDTYDSLEYAAEMREVFDTVRSRPRESWMDFYQWALPVTVAPEYRRAIEPLYKAKGNNPAWIDFVVKIGRLDLPLERNFEVRVADLTVDRLRQVGAKPFSITCSFITPHDPNVVPSPYYEQFSPGEVRLPANRGHREPRFERDWSRTMAAVPGETGVREFLRVYHGCVRLLDDQIGRVLDALEATGRASNTMVVFTSDHGDMAGGHGMLWKSTTAFYEEVVRVPLIFSYPGRIRPGRTEMAADHADLMPTLLELSGKPVPRSVEGHSLAPYLLGRRDPAKAPPYRFSERVPPKYAAPLRVAPGTRGSYMARGNGWKYIWYPDGGEYLYDLKSDPGEMRNRAVDASCREKKAELAREMDRWLAGSPCVRGAGA
jgi:arylsulfatase A-like enzyme